MCTLTAHFSQVSKVAFSSDGGRVTSLASAGSAKIWNAVTGAEVSCCLALHGSRQHLMCELEGTPVD